MTTSISHSNGALTAHFPDPPSTPSLPHGIVSALADTPKEFIFDGGPVWRVERALDAAALTGVEHLIADLRHALQVAMTTPTRVWLGQRLASFFVMFNPTRDVDGRAFTIWNDETTRLLIDLPHDIVASAIDEAIRSSGHGFMPSVGEIRRCADPLVAERRLQIARLMVMERALGDPAASLERSKRRAEQAAHERVMAQMDAEVR